MTPRVPLLAVLLLLLLGVIWGSSYLFTKLGALNGIHPLGYATWVSLGSSSILLIVSFIRGVRPPLSPRHLRFYALAGVVAHATPNVIMVTSMSRIPVAVFAVVNTLQPLLTYAIAKLFGVETFSWRRLAGVLLGVAGLLLIVLPRASLPSPDLVPWVLFAALTPLFYSFGNVYQSTHRPAGSHSIAVGGAVQFMSAAVLLPTALVTGNFHPLWPPFSTGDVAVLAHMTLGSITALLLFEILRLAGPVFLAQVMYISTLTGVVIGMVWFDEEMTVWLAGALVAMLTGLGLVIGSPFRRKNQVDPAAPR